MDSITFITSYLTFYLKGEISKEKNFIKFKIPNTILGFIPLGAAKKTVAINQIASTDTDFRLQFKQLVVGVILAIVGLACMGDSFFAGLILLALGVLGALNAFQTALLVNTTAGESVVLFFVIFEKAKAEQASQMINDLVSGRMDDTNTREQTDRVVDAINNK